MKFGKIKTIILSFLLFALCFTPVFAQSDAYRLVFKREWGTGLPGAVQGRMSITIKGDLDQVESVTYFMDDQEMASMNAPKLKFYFKTDDYPSGPHHFHALVISKDGKSHQTESFSVRFIDPAEAKSMTRKTLVGIGVLALVIVIATSIPFMIQRKKHKSGSADSQKVTTSGLYGAAVCPKCGRAFQRTMAGMNLVVKRYEPCPHCGKWSMTTRASQAEIDAAQLADTPEEDQKAPEQAKPDKLLEQIEDSKYTEL